MDLVVALPPEHGLQGPGLAPPALCPVLCRAPAELPPSKCRPLCPPLHSPAPSAARCAHAEGEGRHRLCHRQALHRLHGSLGGTGHRDPARQVPPASLAGSAADRRGSRPGATSLGVCRFQRDGYLYVRGCLPSADVLAARSFLLQQLHACAPDKLDACGRLRPGAACLGLLTRCRQRLVSRAVQLGSSTPPLTAAGKTSHSTAAWCVCWRRQC